MVDVTTPMEEVTLDHRKAVLLKKLTEAAGRGDLEAIAEVSKEISSLGRTVKLAEDAATEGVRKDAKVKLAALLGSEDVMEDVAQALRAETLSYSVKRDGDDFTDGRGVISNGAVFNVIIPLITEAMKDIKSVKSCSVEFKNDVWVVDVSTSGGAKKASNGNGNGGARGWIKDGITYKLGDVFDTEATVAQVTELDGVKTDGNKAYALKIKVAKAAGYTPQG